MADMIHRSARHAQMCSDPATSIFTTVTFVNKISSLYFARVRKNATGKRYCESGKYH